MPPDHSARYDDVYTDHIGRFSLGTDRRTGEFYLSIPVSNRMVDYEEHFRLTRDEFELFTRDAEQARRFADACRMRLHDERLFRAPGSDRGTAL